MTEWKIFGTGSSLSFDPNTGEIYYDDTASEWRDDAFDLSYTEAEELRDALNAYMAKVKAGDFLDRS